MKRLAIVGFGGAGYNAAKAARSVSPDAEIDVYTDTDVGPYNPMLTTYYVKNAIAYDTLFPFGALEEIAQSLRLNIHTGCPVTGLLAQERAVELANGTRRRYDSILLSTGASALMPPIPGIDLPGVLKMRTAADARLLKERIETGGLEGCAGGGRILGGDQSDRRLLRKGHCLHAGGRRQMDLSGGGFSGDCPEDSGGFGPQECPAGLRTDAGAD